MFFFLTFTLSVVGNTWVILNCWSAEEEQDFFDMVPTEFGSCRSSFYVSNYFQRHCIFVALDRWRCSL